MKKLKERIKGKKAQNEIVGFVVIVVLVVIVGLFLLVFYIRDKPAKQESIEVQNFLGAVMLQTTSCKINLEFEDVQGLIKRCYKGDSCSGVDSCDILERELKTILHNSWLVDSEGPIKSYEMQIYYKDGDFIQDILKVSEGNCSLGTGESGASTIIAYYPGNIVCEASICSV